MTIKSWSKIFPVLGIEKNCIVGHSGEITIGFRVLLKEVFTFTTEEAKAFNDEFVKLIKLLPSNTTFHKQDFFYGDYAKNESTGTSIISNENIRSIIGKPILKHYSNVYITYNPKKPLRKAQSNTFSKGGNNVNRSAGAINTLGKNFINDVFANIEIVTSFFSNMSSVRCYRMDNEQLGSALFDYFNLSYQTQSKDYKEKQLPPLELETELRISDQYIKVISLTKESDKIYSSGINRSILPKDSKYDLNTNISLPTSFVYPIGLGLPINHILNTIITVKDKDDLYFEFRTEKNKLNFLKVFSAAASSKLSELENFETTTSENSYLPVEMAVNVIVHDSNLSVLRDSVSLINTAFSNIGAGVWIENADTANLFFASSPGYAFSNYRVLLSVAELAVCYLHKETHYFSDQKGYLFIDRFGNPVIVDLWDNNHIVNRNMLIIGPSGSGKSFLLNNIIDQCLYLQHHIIIIDIGHSYKRNCIINNGKYYDSREVRKLSFNPFLFCPKDSNGQYNYSLNDDEEVKEPVIITIYTIITTIWKGKEGMSQESKVILKEIIKKYFDYVNNKRLFPDLIGFREFLEIYRSEHIREVDKKYFDFTSLELILKPYTEGENQYLLNAKENIDIIKDKYVVFDLEGVGRNDDFFTLLSVIIIELVVQKCNQLPGVRKDFFIDEGLDFLLNNEMGDYVGQSYRKIRKKEGRISLATQNVSFLRNIPDLIRDSILINSDVKIVLDHSNYRSSFKDLQEVISFTKEDIELLDSVSKGSNYREFYLKMGNKGIVLRNQVSEFAQAVFTSKEKEIVEIDGYYKKSGSMTAAINEYIENKSILKS